MSYTNRFFFVLLSLFLSVSPLFGTEVEDVVDRMNRIFQPEEPVQRSITLEIRNEQGRIATYTGCEIRKSDTDGNRMLLVMNGPKSVEGFATLFFEPADGSVTTTWIYFPPLDRVKKMRNIMAYESFLGSEFTYADLGIFQIKARYRLLADHEEKKENMLVLETIPEPDFYYSRMITFISSETFLPIKRYYYDKSGEHWKTLTFSDVQLDKNKRLLKMKMEMVDNSAGTGTIYRMDNSITGADVPGIPLTPEQLEKLADEPLCGSSVGQGNR